MKTLIKKLMQRLLCMIGFHKDEKWNPYPDVYPECRINRCKFCGYYEWR